MDPKEGRTTAKGIKTQTAQVMENIKAILHAAGFNLSDAIQSNVYLSSMELLKEFNHEYAKYFCKTFPTRATAGIELMRGTLLEISVVAYKDEAGQCEFERY